MSRKECVDAGRRRIDCAWQRLHELRPRGTPSARRTRMTTSRRILVPIDFSPGTRAVLELARTLAQALDASIDLVHVWHPPALIPKGLLVLAPGDGRPPLSIEDLARQSAEVGLKDARATLAHAGIVAHAHIGVGDPAREILEVAKELAADFIVMGTRGRSGLAHVLLGSVAEKVVRHALCPVITVRQLDA